MIDFSAHPLVETAWLEAHLSDDDLCIVDARWRGDGTSRALYQRGHLPGAVHLDWYHDLSWTDEHGVRNLLLPSEPFAAVMEAVGIGDQTRVVAYAETDHSGAARLWWALRFYGNEFLSTFRVEDLAARFAGDFETGLNACYECCDRYAGSNKVALYWEDKDGRSATYTFDELQALSARFANFLRERGIGPGDRVAALLPRVPELFVVVLGTWRAGAIYQTLFTAFGPKAIEYRLERSGAKLVVTDLANRPKLEGIAGLPQIMTIIGDGDTPPEGDLHFWNEVNCQPETFEPVMLKGDDPFLLLFTSGTVGLAKGVAVPLKALLSMMAYMLYGIGLQEQDAYWNVADPGWAYGLYYGVTGPLLLGHATTFYDGPFTTTSTYHILTKYRITNLAAAPTAYRLLLASGEEMARQIQGQ